MKPYVFVYANFTITKFCETEEEAIEKAKQDDECRRVTTSYYAAGDQTRVIWERTRL